MITLDIQRIFECTNMTSLGDYWTVNKISMLKHSESTPQAEKICPLAITIQLANMMSHNHTITSYLWSYTIEAGQYYCIYNTG